MEENGTVMTSEVPRIDSIDIHNIDRNILRIIPEETVRKYRLAPFSREENVVKVAMEDPHDIQALNVLRFLARKESVEFEIFIAERSLLNSLLEVYDSTEEILKDVVQTFKDEQETLDDLDQNKKSKENFSEITSIQDAPVAKLVDVISKHAIDGKASDIHIEPIDDEYRVRFRVDGILHSSLTLPKDVGKAVVARIKILSNLKIDEKRKPQDGRFRMENDTKRIDFRVSTLPVLEGEKVVLRVLDKNSGLGDMESLGLMGKNFRIFNKRIYDPYGIILITGPTGSGKSTTLYAFLRALNKVTTNIITLEDPVEYYLDGINQSQVRPEIGYTFASGLRSILRQDPNVIMVGEIRDSETAELSIHAALTGHLVFSTLHTNTAIGAIPRLIDMGLEGFLLASSLKVVAAQRLVRRVCEKCKTEEKITKEMEDSIRKKLSLLEEGDIKQYGVDLHKPFVFYKGKGCENCGGSGYKGRLAIYEVLEVDDVISSLMVRQHVSDIEIEKQAIAQGMMFMKQDGFLKALQGQTTLAEIERVTEGKASIGGDMDDDAG
ncbi:MAG: type II/IV secretion system protein [Candidatus Moranbacteria bacterium]|nr:type II/IV secretion system protein [Candidatus Moranbacteria bacterium]